jgi:hypothetical protein
MNIPELTKKLYAKTLSLPRFSLWRVDRQEIEFD